MDAGSAHDLADLRLNDHSGSRPETVADGDVRRERLPIHAPLTGVRAALLRGAA